MLEPFLRWRDDELNPFDKWRIRRTNMFLGPSVSEPGPLVPTD